MDEKLVCEIMDNMKIKSTEELLEIWKENNRDQYSYEAFEAVKRPLIQQGVRLPDQKEYIFVSTEEKSDSLRYLVIIIGPIIGFILTGGRLGGIVSGLTYGVIATLLFFKHGELNELKGLLDFFLGLVFGIVFLFIGIFLGNFFPNPFFASQLGVLGFYLGLFVSCKFVKSIDNNRSSD